LPDPVSIRLRAGSNGHLLVMSLEPKRIPVERDRTFAAGPWSAAVFNAHRLCGRHRGRKRERGQNRKEFMQDNHPQGQTYGKGNPNRFWKIAYNLIPIK
jgi:hypothetical protein